HLEGRRGERGGGAHRKGARRRAGGHDERLSPRRDTPERDRAARAGRPGPAAGGRREFPGGREMIFSGGISMAAERSETPWAKVRARIDGDELAIRGQGTEEYIRALARIAGSRTERVRRGPPNSPRRHAAILACMDLADEAYKLRQENKELEKLLEEAR